MSLMQEIYQRIRSLDDPWVTPSLIAALPTSDALATQFIALVLLEKRDPEASLALIEHFHRLPPALQATVQSNVVLTQGALRAALKQTNLPTASNALILIRESKMPELSPLLLTLLCPWPSASQAVETVVPSFTTASAETFLPRRTHYTTQPPSSDANRGTISPQLRRDAAECLWKLARTFETPDQAPETPKLHTLQATIEQALSYYRYHQETGVLQAWATVAGARGLASSGVLGDPYHMATLRLRELLSDPSTPTIRRALLPCLRIPSLAAAALRGLHKTMDSGYLNEALTDWHLLLLPRTQLALRRLMGNSQPAKIPKLAQNNVAQALGLVQWNAAMPGSPVFRANAMAELAGLEDPAARLSVLHHLIAMADDPLLPGIHGIIARFCTDSSPVIARLALRHLLRIKGVYLPRLLLTLINSPHEEVRTLACENLAPVGFTRLWRAWPRLNFAQQISAGKALIKIDSNFHRFLGEKLSRYDRPGRLRALSIVHTLNQGTFFEAGLLQLAGDSDERVASAAVRCLGGVNTSKSIETLEHSLRHPDGRVRANAIEALSQLQSSHHTQALMDMANKEENRPRANAIGALLQMRTADALAALTHMLHDPRPEHRTSALWLVDSLGLMEVAKHVAEISLGDKDARVQARAGKVIRNLIAASPLPKTPETPVTVYRSRNAS